MNVNGKLHSEFGSGPDAVKHVEVLLDGGDAGIPEMSK